MENVLERLPDLQLMSDEDSDDAGSQSSTIFSRSAHLKTLGVEFADASSAEVALAGVDSMGPANGFSMRQHSLTKQDIPNDVTSHTQCHTSPGDKSNGGTLSLYSEFRTHEDSNDSNDTFEQEVNVDWDQFKSEFTESLQESEDRIVSEQHGGGELPIDTVKQQLLVDAILAMHADTQGDTHQGGTGVSGLVNVTGSSEGPRSPSKLRRSLLSMSTLETIHEAELDRLLESDVQVLSGTHTPGGDPPPPAPKLVWEKEDTGQLMKDLELLSKTEAKGTHLGSPRYHSNLEYHSNELASFNHGWKSKESGPIFLDLRPGPEENKSVKEKSDDSIDRSTSDDESDDPFSWITQRKHIKHTLHTTLPPPTHTQSQKSKAQKETVNKKTTLIELSEPQSVEECTIPKVTQSTTASVDFTPVLDPACHSTEGAGARRQRLSSSLTLSSSYSDGEVNNSEGPTAKKESSLATDTTSSPVKGKKSSKKSSKKSKKSRKKDKETGTAKKESSKSAQRKLARALVLERIRNDSLTTSSDEEHCLTPIENGSLSRSLSSGDSGLVFQGSEEDLVAGIDTDKLKLRLQKIIQAKKPPTHFVTPATSVLFHEDVSFEAQPVSMDSSRSTDALLVFPLSGDGLVALPTAVEEGDGCDLQTQLFFHLVLLTWLSVQAASDNNSSPDSSSTPAQVDVETLGNESVETEGASVNEHPFRITGLQQTMLDGCPTLLVGVSVSSQLTADQNVFIGVESNTELNTSSKLTNHLQGFTLNDLLNPVLNDSEVRSLIPGQVLSKLHQISTLPLAAFFSILDDVSALSTPLSFYWHSGYHISSLPRDDSLKSQASVSTTVCTIPGYSLSNLSLVFSILHSVYHNALYLAGLRIVYGEASVKTGGEDITLALAIRAPDAIYRWLDIVGPEDSALARVTDPNSINAKFGSTRSTVLHCVRTPYLVSTALAKWFGGRACLKTGSVLGISDPRTKFERRKRQRVRFSESESEDGLPSPVLEVTFPPLTSNRPCLIAQPYTKVLLIVAPLVPPSLYGTVLSACTRCGFDILGVKRIRLNSKRATAIQIPKLFMVNFTPSSTPPSPAVDFATHPLATGHAPPFPSLVLYLGTESARLHSLSLKEAIFSDLKAVLNVNPTVPNHLHDQEIPESILHTSEVSRETTKVLGSFSLSNTVSSSLPKLHVERSGKGPVFDELCLVAVPQCNSLPKLVNLLQSVYRMTPLKGHQNRLEQASPAPDIAGSYNDDLGGFELLGMKAVPQIPRFHAKRLCPFPSSDPSYQAAVNALSDAPATLLLFRGLECNQRLASLLKPSRTKSPLHTSTLQQQLEVIISKKFEDAYNLSPIFFSDKEMFADSASLGMAPYVPSSWLQDTSILHDLQMPPDSLLSVVRVCMSNKRLVVKVLDKLCRSGFRFVGMRAVSVDQEVRETVLEDLESTDLSSEDGAKSCEPSLVLCVQRLNAVWHLRHTLRPFFEQQQKSKNKQAATISCSDSFKAAVADVSCYFPRGVCCEGNLLKQEYKIECEERDLFGELVLPESCRCLPDSSLLNFVSPLLETTAMIIPLALVTKGEGQSTAGFVEVLEFLTECGFEIRGLKMVLFSQQLAEELLGVCDCVSTVKADDMTSGPCIVLVLKRDNAASCCQSIFKSALLRIYRPGSSSVDKLLSQMLVPASALQAQNVLKLVKAQNSE